MARLKSLRVYDNVLRSELSSSRSLKQQLQPLAAKATRAAKQVANEKVKRVSGAYLAGFQSRVGPGTGRAVATIITENAARHADILEKGSRPHEINSPVQVRPGVWRFIRIHPGTKAYRVIETALRRLMQGGT